MAITFDIRTSPALLTDKYYVQTCAYKLFFFYHCDDYET